jgi:hypothetical protein
MPSLYRVLLGMSLQRGQNPFTVIILAAAIFIFLPRKINDFLK